MLSEHAVDITFLQRATETFSASIQVIQVTQVAAHDGLLCDLFTAMAEVSEGDVNRVQ